jgi:hypothetical protein
MKLHLSPRIDADPMQQFRQMFPGQLPTATNPANSLGLGLTISFSGEQAVDVPGGQRLGLPGGRATFGVRRGELRFVLENCYLPLEDTVLSKPFRVSIEIERQQTKSRELNASTSLDAHNLAAKSASGSAETTTVEVFQVKKVGSEERPAWIFESYGDRTILDGILKEQLLGLLCTEENSCINASFVVRAEDVLLTWGELGMVSDITRNKLAVIERAIVKHCIKPLVASDALCQARWENG